MHHMVVICGPTGTGKTKLALAVAKKFDGALISADSRQIYTGMDIGTGKDIPDPREIYGTKQSEVFKDTTYEFYAYDINGVPVWMYDVVKPDEEFSVAHYQFLAKSVLQRIYASQKLPIIVGGTGFYIRSLIQDIETIAIPPNPKLRKQLETYTVFGLQDELKRMAPDIWDSLNNSDKLNAYRLIRKIEIADAVNRGFRIRASDMSEEQLRKQAREQKIIGLRSDMARLDAHIDERVDTRVTQGIEHEVETLYQTYGRWDLQAFQSLGYREWKTWLEQPALRTDSLRNGIIAQWKMDEHAYARRQMTWFQKQEGIQWYPVDDATYTDTVISDIGAWYNNEKS